ncbi:MAG: hypothetical protein ACR2KV_08030 [Solirubrobacteraceae bacterium]
MARRVDLDARPHAEEARSAAGLCDRRGLTKAEVARRAGRSRVAGSDLARRLALPDEARALAVEFGEAFALVLGRDARVEPRPRGVLARVVDVGDAAAAQHALHHAGTAGAPTEGERTSTDVYQVVADVRM